ncbi:MAG TPA: hypothetical protein VMW01_16420 [Williamwhitmania sp.]|nr:hypothetical protein [Williamwhitmania sp.]
MKSVESIEQIKKLIGESVHNGELSNNDLVQIIELCGSYLNPLTIATYARIHGISYNGAKKKRKTPLLGVNYIIDND